MKDVEYWQEYTHNSQVKIGHLQSLLYLCRRAGDKAAQNKPAKDQHDGCNHQGGNHCNPDGRPHSPADAPVFPGSQILSHIGNHGVTVGGGRNFQNAVQFIGGSKAGNKDDAEAVNHKLDNHSSYGNDTVLESHGEAYQFC